jgi:hypothetical protein
VVELKENLKFLKIVELFTNWFTGGNYPNNT